MIYRIFRHLKYKLVEKPKYKELKEKLFSEMVSVGKFTYGITPNNVVFFNEGDAKIIIGKFCSIASGVKFMAGGEHDFKRVSTFPFSKKMNKLLNKQESFSKGEIKIGNDVWIGTDAIILSGVNIGDGAVIAARSVVVKNIPPYAIVGGNPAKIIKMRFSDSQIVDLLKIKWWDWDEEFIRENIEYFYGNVEAFISKFRVKN